MNQELRKEFVKTVRLIRGADVTAWNAFLAVLKARSMELDDNLISAQDPHQLAVIQGAAREARALITALETAPLTAETLEMKERNNALPKHR